MIIRGKKYAKIQKEMIRRRRKTKWMESDMEQKEKKMNIKGRRGQEGDEREKQEESYGTEMKSQKHE